MKKRLALVLLCGFALLNPVASGLAAENNDFYDDAPTYELKGPALRVDGEVANPGTVDFSTIPLRSLIVKEAVSTQKGARFVGSYRYDGVSLFDILKERYPRKRNQKEFNSVIDLLLVIENAKGERVVASWGEVFYPPTRHQIILATKVSPIVPSKTKEQWPLPKRTKLVFGNDLLSERNLTDPTRITILSSPHRFKRQGKRFNPDFSLYQDGKLSGRVIRLPSAETRTYPSVFFGRGKGFHGLERFQGVLLKDALGRLYPANPDRLKHAFFTVAGADGYRVVLSFSELFNRNDDAEFLLYDKGKSKEGGRFNLFPAADFFSDRAVKAISEIHLDRIP